MGFAVITTIGLCSVRTCTRTATRCSAIFTASPFVTFRCGDADDGLSGAVNLNRFEATRYVIATAQNGLMSQAMAAEAAKVKTGSGQSSRPPGTVDAG